MAFPVAAAIAGGVSLLNSFMQGNQNDENLRAQQIENERQRRFALEMWKKNNEYNLPINQMARLRNAGINPHLAYSNGTPMNTSNAPAQASTSALPAGQAPQLNIGEIAQLMLTKAQKENIEADTAKKKAEAESVGVSTESAKIELSYKEKQIVSQLGLTEQQVAESKSRIDSAILQDSKVKYEIDKIVSEKKLNDQQRENLKKTIALIVAQVQNVKADTELKREQKYVAQAQRGNLEASTRLLTAQAGREEIKMKYDAQVIETSIKQVLKSIEHTDATIKNISFQQVSTIVGSLMSHVMKGYPTELIMP